MTANPLRAVASGVVGAAVLTAVHEGARRVLPDAPRMDVMGMRVLARVGLQAENADEAVLHRLALIGDLVSNSIYYSAVCGSTSSETWARGMLLGTAAGVGALAIPAHVGLGEPPHSNSRRNQVMTIAWYVLGGLAAAAVANAWPRQRRRSDVAVRKQNVADVTRYLRAHFPNASIRSSTDGLTANEVFTVRESDTTRYVEVTKRSLEADAGAPLGSVIEELGLASAVKSLDANCTLRVAATGLERVS